MARARSDVAGLLTRAGIIADPTKVKRVSIEFEASGVVTAIIEQFLTPESVEFVTQSLRVVEDIDPSTVEGGGS